MIRFLRASLVLALLSTACSSGGSGPPTQVDPCSEVQPLTLAQDVDKVRLKGPVALTASGGSGYYTYSVVAGGSSGQMNGSRFVAGTTPATDTLVVEDQRCPGLKATTQVQVVPAFDVAPSRGMLKPGTSFQIQVAGLLGPAVFTLDSSAAGSTLSPKGLYTAGAKEGLDLVRVQDSRAGDVAQLQFTISASAALKGDPVMMALPSGSSVPLGTVGGTDRITWSLVSGPGRVQDGRFVAGVDDKGAATLQALDPFTGQKTTVSVRVLSELARDTQAHGQLTDTSSVVTADFDGDGIADVAVGRPESDLAHPTAGAVFIFKGSKDGLPSKPTWTLTGDTDTARFGDAMVAGDLDGDHTAELAVSSPGADITTRDSGAVYFYRWGKNGPERIRPPLAGVGSGLFGAGMELADVDGDGDLDLIVGSPTADLSTAGNNRGIVDVFLLTPGQPIPELPSLRLGGSDLGQSGSPESRKGTELGRSLVVADFNGDGRADIAALNKVSRFSGGTSLGVVQMAVAVYFGRDKTDGTRFRETPDVYVLPSNSADSNEGTWKLDVVPAEGTRPSLLMVVADRADSPDLSKSGGNVAMGDAGGVLLFDLTAFKPTGNPSTTPPQVTRDAAWARLYGDTIGGAAGRSWALADVDGKPGLELLLGIPYASPTAALSLAGKVLVYPLASMSAGTVLNKSTVSLPGTAKTDTYGVGLAAWPLQDSAGLVVFAGRASADGLAFTGRVDGYVKSGASLAEWKRTGVMLPAQPSVERFGEVVAVAKGKLGGAVALVGSPGFSGPGSGDGNALSVGRAWTFDTTTGVGTLAAEGVVSTPTWQGRAVGTDVAFTDFNGDGLADAVIGAPLFSMPGTSARATEITPIYAQERTECVPTGNSLAAGGVLVSLAQADGSFKPAYRLWAPGDIASCTPAGTATCQRRSMGRGVVGGFDFNGDGKQDIGLLRNNGFELLLGRAPDDATLAKLTMGCDPLYTAPFSTQQTSALAVLGDLDGDKCDEVAWRYSDGSTRSGLVILFGYDVNGVKCGGNKVARTVRLVADGEVGDPYLGLGLATTRAGRFLGKTGADYLATTATSYPYQSVTQQVVLLFDVAELVKRRPTSGEAVVNALDTALTPKVLVHRSRAVGFGTAMVGNVDLTGDGVPELIIGAPGATVASDGGGAVFVYSGGTASTGALSPFITLTGDVSERANFGQELALVPGSGSLPPTLVVGAPLSYRTGTVNGTAFLVPLGF